MRDTLAARNGNLIDGDHGTELVDQVLD